MIQNLATRGVTFIEFAIYATLFALLVGSINMAQNLFHATKIRNTIAQIHQFNIATNTFNSKFGGIPGDLRKAEAFGLSEGSCLLDTGVGCNGNGNYLLEDGNKKEDHFSGEVASFWFHLSKQNVFEKKYDGKTNSLDIGFPKTALEHGGFHIYSHQGTNYYQIGATSNADPGSTLQHFEDNLTSFEAHAIDSKLDDSLPLRGHVIARGATGGFENQANAKPSAGPSSDLDVCILTNTVVETYNVDKEGFLCQLRIRMEY